MKKSLQKTPYLKRKSQALKKSSISSSTTRQRKSLSEKKAHSAERNHLRDTVRQQADSLKIQKGQLKQGVEREKLAEAQVLIRAKAMDSTIDGIFIIDAQKDDFPIIYSNQSFQAMTGYAKKNILGKNYFLLYGVAADPRTLKEIKSTVLQNKPFHGEMLNSRKNGEKFWNYLRIAPVCDASGVVTHYIGIQTDTTLMKQRDLEIKEQREELLHVTRVGKLAEFVSSLAHEISQPLTAILSYSQAAQRMLGSREPQVQEILQYIVNDDQRAAEVIRRLRSLLKKNEPEFEPLNMNVLIDETVDLMMIDVTVRNKVIRTELPSKLPLISGDRIQLQQVLLNLISNSLDAMEGRDDSRELVIRAFLKDPGTVMVEVKDSGCGIPAENMEKLFKHFFTSKPDGLGMGLSISRSIVEAHGGRLEAKNNPDGGATFYFTVPVGKKGSS